MKKFLPIITLPLLLAACSDEAPNSNISNSDTNRFVIAAQVQGSNAVSNILLSAATIDTGTLSAVGQGLLNDGASNWIWHSDRYLYALTYNQGNAGTTRSFAINDNGNLEQRPLEYKISRFTTYGTYDNNIISTSTGDGPAALADPNGYRPKYLLASYIDVTSETARQNDTSQGAYSMENLLGNGEFVTLAGIEQRGNLIFSGAIPMGLSQYGAAQGGGKWIRPGFEDLVKTADGGSASSAYKKGELQWTQYPNEGWVAIYNNADLTHPTLIKSDKISYPAGRFKSRYYQTIHKVDNGDIYVFSPSYAKTMTDPRQQTTLPAGVVRIPAGKTAFDSYYCNLEELSGGRSFLKCEPAGGNYFILTMYDRPLTEKGFVATDLAIFDATRKTLKYVKGLPAGITSIADNMLVHGDRVYAAIHTTDGYPAIYAIDPATATATRGLTVEATTITGFGLLRR